METACSSQIAFKPWMPNLKQEQAEHSSNETKSTPDTISCCRICLRNTSLNNLQIITKEHKIKILALVKKKIQRKDQYRHICSNCSNLLDIILDFRTATIQANRLLLAGKTNIKSDDWYRQDRVEAVALCRDLVHNHRRMIESAYREYRAELEPQTIVDGLSSSEPDIKLEPVCELTEGVVPVEASDDQPNEQVRANYSLSDEDGDGRETVTSTSDDDVPLNERKRRSNRVENVHSGNRRGRKPKEQPEFMPQLCDFCGKRVCGESAEGHKNQHLGIKPYSCTVTGCTLTFFGRYNRLRHVKRMHSENGVEVHNCHVCGKTIRGPSRALKYHLQRHEQNQKAEKDFICNVCGKGFTLQRYLTQHSIIHSGEFPHKCSYCGKKFNNKWGMRTHEKNIHEKRSHASTDTDRSEIRRVEGCNTMKCSKEQQHSNH
ncbi:zinc finger protein 184-like [Topomyia yanbarensis]|uniref:zinc finger protein 184-like n=1 Tax=Topomyia yanbarensis TaxID=2498891 RepID=UPI00273C1AA9|nr:zinc finger protein 184-like [Topomyia yanbarensis]XP_058835348.1 zinc finger protein 184-like [Topomyia yanbarensis]